MKNNETLSPLPTDADPSLVTQGLSYGSSSYAGSPYYGGDGGTEDAGGLDLLRIIRFILKRWKTVLLVAGIGLACGFLSLSMATPIYCAESEIEMSVCRPKIVQSEAVFEDQVRDTDVIINTRFAKFRSPAMEDLVVEKYAKKYPNPSIKEKELKKTLRSSVVWTKDRKANIVRVSVRDSDPEFAARLANILSVSAGELMVRENQALSDEAVKWLKDQVEERRADLDAVEQELGKVRQEARLDALKQRKEALGASLIALSEEYVSQQNQLAEAKTQYAFLEMRKETGSDLETLPESLPRQEHLSRLIERWRISDEAFRTASVRYTDQHPDYQAAEKKLQSDRDQLNRFSLTLIQTLENQIRLLESQNGQVEGRMIAVEKESLELEQKLVQGEQRLTRLDRNYAAADNAYKALLKRMEEVRMSADETMAFTKVIREAAVPGHPVSPKRSQTLALALFLGLIAGIGLVCIIEFWGDRVSSIHELEALGLNIVGVIPRQKNSTSRGDLAMIGLRDKFSHVFELFAGFTAMLASNKFRDQTRVLLVNSAMPNEGKTICASNLAINSALNGARTLLIDCDLRRPRLAGIFGISAEHPSLLEWLSDDKKTLEYDQLLNREVHGNLDLITSRPLHDVNPAELLGRGHIRDLILWARENYDRVIIDSPPFGLAGDVQVLANEVDSILLVSRIGVTQRGALRHALKRFAEMDVVIVGVIANDVVFDLKNKIGGGYRYNQYVSYGKY